MKKIFLLSTLFIFASFSIAAQEPAPVKQINGGVLNGKANNLVKPAFPAAARAVRASGAVSVQVLIDEQGNVASASAISGHPLLRQAAEQAALASKFSPTTLSGRPVKVSGIVTYNFASEMTFTQIGFDLALIEKSKEVPGNIFVGNITGNVPADWEKERSDLSMLERATKQAFIVRPANEGIGQGSTGNNKTSTTQNYPADVKTVQGEGFIRDETLDRVKLAEGLQKYIENRLASERVNLWKFQVGKSLGRIAAQSENETVIKTEASNLNDLILSVPNEISSTARLESLRKLIGLIQTTDSTPERIAGIKASAAGLRNS